MKGYMVANCMAALNGSIPINVADSPSNTAMGPQVGVDLWFSPSSAAAQAQECVLYLAVADSGHARSEPMAWLDS